MILAAFKIPKHRLIPDNTLNCGGKYFYEINENNGKYKVESVSFP
ncbi:hypothetical protein LY54_01565 [Salegentibacter mishustinae]|nr:hypothetical protein LY54_01565 [Salegentibacter mishustinae]